MHAYGYRRDSTSCHEIYEIHLNRMSNSLSAAPQSVAQVPCIMRCCFSAGQAGALHHCQCKEAFPQGPKPSRLLKLRLPLSTWKLAISRSNGSSACPFQGTNYRTRWEAPWDGIWHCCSVMHGSNFCKPELHKVWWLLCHARCPQPDQAATDCGGALASAPADAGVAPAWM